MRISLSFQITTLLIFKVSNAKHLRIQKDTCKRAQWQRATLKLESKQENEKKFMVIHVLLHGIGARDERILPMHQTLHLAALPQQLCVVIPTRTCSCHADACSCASCSPHQYHQGPQPRMEYQQGRTLGAVPGEASYCLQPNVRLL